MIKADYVVPMHEYLCNVFRAVRVEKRAKARRMTSNVDIARYRDSDCVATFDVIRSMSLSAHTAPTFRVPM